MKLEQALEELIRLAGEAPADMNEAETLRWEFYTEVLEKTENFYKAAKTFADTVAPGLLEALELSELRFKSGQDSLWRLHELEARNAALVEALRWYGQKETWDYSVVQIGTNGPYDVYKPANQDNGHKARQALAENGEA